MTHRKFKRFRYFHFTTRIVHPLWEQMTLEQNWEHMTKSLADVLELNGDETLTWHSGIVMSNHIHVLFSLEGFNENSIILDLERVLKSRMKIQATLFQRPLRCEPLEHLRHLRSAYKFIYRNPIEARVVKRVEEYQYSSLAMLLGRKNQFHQNPFVDPFEIIQDLPKQLRWLNSETEIRAIWEDYLQDDGLGFGLQIDLKRCMQRVRHKN